LLREPFSRHTLSNINAIGRRSPDIPSCVWQWQCVALIRFAPAPGVAVGGTY
jgi:hypothetical protein